MKNFKPKSLKIISLMLTSAITMQTCAAFAMPEWATNIKNKVKESYKNNPKTTVAVAATGSIALTTAGILAAKKLLAKPVKPSKMAKIKNLLLSKYSLIGLGAAGVAGLILWLLKKSGPNTTVKPAPVIQTPVIQTPVIQTPVIQTPVIQTPVIQTPVIQTPVIQTPAIQTPAIQTPAIQTPAIQTPAIQTPAIQTPAIQTPVIQTPINPEPIIPKPVIPAPVNPVIIKQKPVRPAKNNRLKLAEGQEDARKKRALDKAKKDGKATILINLQNTQQNNQPKPNVSQNPANNNQAAPVVVDHSPTDSQANNSPKPENNSNQVNNQANNKPKPGVSQTRKNNKTNVKPQIDFIEKNKREIAKKAEEMRKRREKKNKAN